MTVIVTGLTRDNYILQMDDRRHTTTMASAEKSKEAADYNDFRLLVELIRDDKEDDFHRLIDSKDFSREAWNGGRNVYNVPAPINLAAWKGQLIMVRSLLQRGIDYYEERIDEDGYMGIYYTDDDSIDGIDDYYNHACFGYPPIVSAVLLGHLEVVRVFVEEFGYDANVFKHAEPDDTGLIGMGTNPRKCEECHLLSHAIESGNEKLVKYLIDAGSDVNWVDSEGTVLHKLIKIDNWELCKLLFSRGFNQIDARNNKDGYGTTAFLEALLSSCWSICDVLTAHGADVNLGDCNYPNLFACATMYGLTCNVDHLKYLQKHGADPDVTSEFGQFGPRPIDIAVERNRFIAVHYLAIVLNIPLTGELVQRCLQGLTLDPIVSKEYRVSTKILLLKAGYHIDPESFDSLSKLVTDLPPGAASTYISEVLFHPRRLVDTCCFRIRRVLGKSLPERVDRLPLPKKLINFIKLTHVEPLVYTDETIPHDDIDDIFS